MSMAGVRSVGRVPAEPRRIDLPRESVNESEAESKRASERAILGISASRRGEPHRTAPHRTVSHRTAPRRAAISLEDVPRVVEDVGDDNVNAHRQLVSVGERAGVVDNERYRRRRRRRCRRRLVSSRPVASRHVSSRPSLFFLSLSLSLSLSRSRRSAVLQNDVNGPVRAIDISSLTPR